MKKLLFLSSLSMLLFINCAPIKVSYDYDKNISFEEYSSYNYASGIKMDLGELDQRRFIKQLDSVLHAQGFIKNETPDFYIDLNSKTYRSISRNTIGVGIGSGGGNLGVGVSGGIPIGGTELNQEIQVNFLDGTSHALIWQAKVDTRVKERASPEKKKNLYTTMISKVLEGCPPKK